MASNWFDPADETTALGQREDLLFRHNHDRLIKDLTPKPVMDHMITDLVLDFDDYEDVDAERTRRDKAAKLLAIVRKSNMKCFKSFRKALRAVQPHLDAYLDEPITLPPPPVGSSSKSDDLDPRYNRTVSSQFPNVICTEVGRWEVVARKLGFTPADIDEVSHHTHEPLSEQVARMVERWMSIRSHAATYQEFIQALRTAGKEESVIATVKQLALEQA